MYYFLFLLALINTLLFLFLSGIHFYWASGGKWASDAVLPTQKDGTMALQPNALATILVALFLLVFAFASFGNTGLIRQADPQYFYFGNWIIGLLFCWRAIGDGKFIGFTKSIKGTLFARNDTKIYSPLCLFIGCVAFLMLLCRHFIS